MTYNRPALWHFTCGHSHDLLGDRGVLFPRPHPLISAFRGLVWMTDDPSPERDDVGLTMGLLDCDRMEFRYRIEPVTESCVSWLSVRHLCRRSVLRDLETFGRPETWWVSPLPVQGILDQMEIAA